MKRIDVRGVPVLEMATNSKAQALKVLEEAAELVETWKDYDAKRAAAAPVMQSSGYGLVDSWAGTVARRARELLVAEACDVIVATVGLLDSAGVHDYEVWDAMQECADRYRHHVKPRTLEDILQCAGVSVAAIEDVAAEIRELMEASE